MKKLFLIISIILISTYAHAISYTDAELQVLLDQINSAVVSSSGASDSGKLVELNASGKIAADFIAGGSTEYQPLDSDLTSIAALTTTAYGRALLELADEAALQSLITSPWADADVANDITITNLSQVQDVTADVDDVNIIDGISDSGSLTAAELLYMDGVTSGVQSQINGKEDSDAAIAKTDESETVTTQWDFSNNAPTVPNETYDSTNWDGDDGVAAKNDVRDKLEGVYIDNKTTVVVSSSGSELTAAGLVDDDSGASPTAGSPDVSGYNVGDIIIDPETTPDSIWICQDTTDGAAVWAKMYAQTSTDTPAVVGYRSSGANVFSISAPDADHQDDDSDDDPDDNDFYQITRLKSAVAGALENFISMDGQADDGAGADFNLVI